MYGFTSSQQKTCADDIVPVSDLGVASQARRRSVGVDISIGSAAVGIMRWQAKDVQRIIA